MDHVLVDTDQPPRAPTHPPATAMGVSAKRGGAGPAQHRRTPLGASGAANADANVPAQAPPKPSSSISAVCGSATRAPYHSVPESGRQSSIKRKSPGVDREVAHAPPPRPPVPLDADLKHLKRNRADPFAHVFDTASSPSTVSPQSSLHVDVDRTVHTSPLSAPLPMSLAARITAAATAAGSTSSSSCSASASSSAVRRIGTQQPQQPVAYLPDDVMLNVLGLVVGNADTWEHLPLVCRRWHALCCQPRLYVGEPLVLPAAPEPSTAAESAEDGDCNDSGAVPAAADGASAGASADSSNSNGGSGASKTPPEPAATAATAVGAGGMNWRLFRNLGVRYRGTEGVLHHCINRQTGRALAYRRARVFPDGDGVPYYMLRELAFMRRASHPCLAKLEMVNLHKDNLSMFFEFVGTTLHAVLYPSANCEQGVLLPPHRIRSYMFQLLQAMSYCHRRGLFHRNLKPKHILLEANGRLKVSDFALARLTSLPRRAYTTQVVTLWYRAPEVILGGDYEAAIDVWSIGCIFAEMLFGAPTFMCMYETEVDHLMKIFRLLGTPTEETWPGFGKLPHASGQAFPVWPARPFTRVFPVAKGMNEATVALVQQFLRLDPNRRVSTHGALKDAYFTQPLQLTPSDRVRHLQSPRHADPTCVEAQLSLPFEADVLPKIVPDAVSDTESFPHTMRQVLLERLAVDGRAGRLPRDVMHLQEEVHSIHRSMLVDWLVEVVEVFGMCDRSPFLAVWYLDQYLNARVNTRAKFQVVGAACLHIASKCEDLSYIGAKELVDCGDRTFSRKELLQVEEHVLVAMEFQLAVATVYDFVQVFLQLFPAAADLKVHHLAGFLSELVLMEADFANLSPALVAAGLVVYSRFARSAHPFVPAGFEDFFFNGENNVDHARDRRLLTKADLRTTVEALHNLHLYAAHSPLRKIFARWGKSDLGSISAIKAPALLTLPW